MGTWFKAPKDMRGPCITAAGFGGWTAYTVLVEFANEDGECWPSEARIAQEMGGISERNVRRIMAQLETAGLITRKRRGNHQTMLYRLESRADKSVRSEMRPAESSRPDKSVQSRPDKSDIQTGQIRSADRTDLSGKLDLRTRPEELDQKKVIEKNSTRPQSPKAPEEIGQAEVDFLFTSTVSRPMPIGFHWVDRLGLPDVEAEDLERALREHGVPFIAEKCWRRGSRMPTGDAFQRRAYGWLQKASDTIEDIACERRLRAHYTALFAKAQAKGAEKAKTNPPSYQPGKFIDRDAWAEQVPEIIDLAREAYEAEQREISRAAG